MSLAMLGVIAMQYYFLKESYVLKSQLFDQSVNDALKTVALKIERSEAAEFLVKRADSEKKEEEERRLKEKLRLARNEDNKGRKEDPTLTFIRKLKADQAKSDSLFKVRDSLLRNRYPNILVYNGPIKTDFVENTANVRYDFEEIVDEFGYRQVVKETYQPTKNHKFSKKIGNVVIDSIKQYVVVDPNLGPVVKTLGKPNYLSSISPKQLEEANKKELLQKQKAKEVKLYLDSLESLKNRRDLFDDIASEYQRVNIPLTKRIQKHILDSLLILELANNGVLMKFNYTVVTNNNRIVFASQRHLTDPDSEKNVYKTALFPRDMVRDGGILKVSFPDKKSLILSNMDTVLVSSGALLLVLFGCFSFTIFSIIRQKKISEMKTDFINNMTHEFKTPVATIMIASEALKDPEVNEDKARVQRLAGVIYDENVRLGDHIERVLNIAKIERDDFKLENVPVNIHDLIIGVTDSMSLQLQKNNANVDLQLEATSPLIMGDELHLTNVIYNLMDNANKYGGDNPEITITTYNKGKELIMTVADKGIGMSREQQNRIFDQFYRVPKGNVHDVKGFGLGLNYVSMMVKKMGGSVSVKSEKDVGSEFELRFISYKYD
ncbi:histidine kinase [Pseudopedobacter saltans DSM 12145]|uniref:histidine kinase n=2 Tax=Pseudopedobacter saltans TaxID=151895 RepID=F0SAN1_PSESL|nr:histidine kinase [Pseudopedobacter saltans DSM 12145]